jgi:hypothetical protein
MKYVTIALLAVGLAACNVGASSPSPEPLPSIGAASMPAEHSMAPDMSMGTDTAVACEDAFAGLDLTDLAGLSSLDAASDLLDDTIAGCGSVAEWQAKAEAVMPLVDLETAETFLAARCDANPTLATSAVCEEVAM